ncbi:MAG: alpha/beta hydrolase family protein [Calditrichia bacterium]
MGGWLIFFPGEDVAPTNNRVSDQQSYLLEDKIGWYRDENNIDWMITWSANSALLMNCFKPLRSRPLIALSDTCFQWQRSSYSTRVCFQYDPAGTVRSLSLADSTVRYMTRLPDQHYIQQEIRYTNVTDSIELTATLFKPLSTKPHPVVVLLHGSGTSDRDSFWYLYQADFLAKQGIAVLLPDKRGCGKSEGNWKTSSFKSFSEDALAAVDYLKLNGHAQGKIGFVGFSQGGWIAPLAASNSNTIAFCIVVSSSAFTPYQQLNYEIKSDIIASGAPDFIASLVAPLFSYRVTRTRKFWWKQNKDYDPLTHWPVGKPALMILGENDTQVWAEGSSKRFSEIVNVSDDSASQVKLYPNTGHALIDPESGWIVHNYLEFLSGWILNIAS